jgi:hypothetical protein
MALRDKLRERVQPLLEPGEQVQAVIPCQTGPSPWFAALSYLYVFFGAKFWLLVATDRNLVAMKASVWVPFKPKSVEQRLPRSTRIGPVSGLWGKSDVLGKTHIHKRFHRDVEIADSMLGAAAGASGAAASPTTPPGWYPDPNQPGSQRYWDGSAWTEHTNASG